MAEVSPSRPTSFTHIRTVLRSQSLPILLRPLLACDASAFAALLSDPRNMLYESTAPPQTMTLATAEAAIGRMRESAATPSVVDEASGRVASGPLSSSSSTPTRVGDVGVTLDPTYRGRGFVLEAIRLSVDWGFRPLGEGGLQLDRVSAGTLEKNAPMVTLLEKKMGWSGTRRISEDDRRKNKKEVLFEVTPGTWR